MGIIVILFGGKNKVTCADCGAPFYLPFKPSEGKPVYCKACVKQKQEKEIAKAAKQKALAKIAKLRK
jgi:CxxC-x17-CxxC domain-containing protein